jgi:hypothetical protein
VHEVKKDGGKSETIKDKRLLRAEGRSQGYKNF